MAARVSDRLDGTSGSSSDALSRRYGDPIAYRPRLAHALGSANAGVFISQLLYWTPRSPDPDGWIYKSIDGWHQETALTKREQMTVRAGLRSLGVLEERHDRLQHRLYYRLRIDLLDRLLCPEEVPTAKSESALPEVRLRTSGSDEAHEAGAEAHEAGALPHFVLITENTTENTSDTPPSEESPLLGRSKGGPTSGTQPSPRKVRKKASGDHASLIRHFDQAWQLRYGAKRYFAKGKDGKAIQTILDAAGGLEKSKRVIDAYFSCDDQFIATQKHSLALLVSQVNRFIAEAVGDPTGSRFDADLSHLTSDAFGRNPTAEELKIICAPPEPGEPGHPETFQPRTRQRESA